MEIGNEISQKIRSAIKAKLVDLGAYVDDELPDYIMVMVANKKTTAQMADDLSLFLAGNTLKFTAWLTSLLEKLQSIGTSKTEAEVKPEPKEEEQREEPEVKKKVEPAEPHEDLIKISAEDVDEFDDDDDPDGPAIKKKKKGTSSSVVSELKTTSAASRLRKIARNRRPSPPRARRGSTDAGSIKSRIGSTVGAVLKHDVYSDEEEYDPHKPSIGKVASVVKVTERKSSVPAALQANRSLLLKAMTEAQSSVERASKRQPPPASTSASQRSEHRASVRSRLGHSRRTSDTGRLRSSPARDSRRPAERRHVSTSAKPVQQNSEREETLKKLKKEALESLQRKQKKTQDLDEDIVRLNVPEDTRSILCASTDDSITMPDDFADYEDVDSDLNITAERGPSPNFVVTLDNVGQELLDRNLESDQEMEANQEEENGRKEAEGMDVDGESREKCRFYPSCKNGDGCPYYHPTEQCTNFPNCRYGNKCLYIHPKCRFDGNCTRHNCQYTHALPRPRSFPMAAPTVIVQPIKVPVFSSESMKKPPSAAKHPSQVTCRFFPKCTNMNCSFYHPKPCRFGVSCNSKDTCQFLHPDLPNRQSLKWKPSNSAATGAPTESLPSSVSLTSPKSLSVPIMSN